MGRGQSFGSRPTRATGASAAVVRREPLWLDARTLDRQSTRARPRSCPAFASVPSTSPLAIEAVAERYERRLARARDPKLSARAGCTSRVHRDNRKHRRTSGARRWAVPSLREQRDRAADEHGAHAHRNRLRLAPRPIAQPRGPAHPGVAMPCVLAKIQGSRDPGGEATVLGRVADRRQAFARGSSRVIREDNADRTWSGGGMGS